MTNYRVCYMSDTAGAARERELLTLPEHLSSSPVLSGVRVTQSSVLCVVM